VPSSATDKNTMTTAEMIWTRAIQHHGGVSRRIDASVRPAGEAKRFVGKGKAGQQKTEQQSAEQLRASAAEAGGIGGGWANSSAVENERTDTDVAAPVRCRKREREGGAATTASCNARAAVAAL